MKNRSNAHRGVLVSLLTITWLILSVARCQSVCPARCLCYLDQTPRSIQCSKQGIQAFPENISDIVEHLDLSNNLLVEITDEINWLTELQYLNLARNRLASLPSDLAKLTKLQRLDLSSNLITNTAYIVSISQLSSLKVLYVSWNLLTDLKGLTSEVLQALDASHCFIKELGNASLDGLPALTSLNLAGNPLENIQAPTSETLHWLDMSDCSLNYLYPDTFSGFPALEELRLANNPKLVYSTRHATLQHPTLKRLDVSRCNLDRPGLHGLPKLTHARLSRNTIRILPDRIFAKNNQLMYLYLNANNLERLNASTFDGLVKLQLLDLSANGLEEIHQLAFQENIDLKLLNFSYNMLHRFPRLSCLVTSLDVSFNFISRFEANSLEDMPRIRSLNLKDNQLQYLPRGLRTATLKILNVQRNRLVELRNNSFTGMPSLQKIDLSGNRLTEAMDPELFRNNLDLAIINLEDNPWRCDCTQLYVTFEYLTVSGKTARSSLICQSPANVSGYSWEAACFDAWDSHLYYNRDRTWGIVMVSLLISVVLFGSVVSIKHTMRIKRRALEQRQQLERVQERERSLALHRSNQRLEDELVELVRPREPRINPLELVSPPTYEEAVQMSRLVRSMDDLDEITVENDTLRAISSVDNLRTKKRRSKRSARKRTNSEDDLLRREERRQERIRRERSNVRDEDQNTRDSRTLARRPRRHSTADDILESSSSKDRPRPQTPNTRKRKRRQMIRDEHVTDDEDSDAIGSSKSVVIRELRREPRSAYRNSFVGSRES